jgi:hypothetical protein
MTATNSKLDAIKGNTDGLKTDNPDLSEGTSEQLGRGEGDIWGDGVQPDPGNIDMTGFGFSRTCPSPPSFTVMGRSLTVDTTTLCDTAHIFGLLVLAITAAQCAYIFAGRAS